MMTRSVLILEKNAINGEKLRTLMTDELACSVVLVGNELAAVRELTTHFFHLMIVGFHQRRRRESLRLLEILLIERKVVNAPPIMVISDDPDPAVVKQCVKAGVADYVLYPEDLKAILPRAEKALAESADIGGTLVRVAVVFLGPAAPILLEQQIRKHLDAQSLRELKSEHLPELFYHLFITVTPILREKITLFRRRIEQVFGIRVKLRE